MLAVAVVLAAAWAAFHAWRSPTFVLTPFEGRPPVAPLYAFFLPAVTPWVVLALAFAVAAVWLASRRAPSSTPAFLVSAVVVAAGLALSVHAARSGGLPGRELAFYQGEEVIEDARVFESAGELLRGYNERQPRLSLHGRVRPPGAALLYRGLLSVLPDSLPVLGTALGLLAALLPLLAYALARQVGSDEPRARAAALLTAVAPPAVLFGAVSLDAVLALLAGAAFALTAWELARPAPAKRFDLGLVLFAGLMFSYTGFVVGLVCAAWIVLERWRRPGELLRGALEIALGVVPPFLLLKLAYGFDAWQCFTTARHLNTEMMSQVIGKPTGSPAVWAYASLGNLLAFTIALGPALLGALLVLRKSELPQRARTLALSVALALAVASLGGLYLMETERIFGFFVPALAVLAASARRIDLGEVVGATAALALVLELLLFTLW